MKLSTAGYSSLIRRRVLVKYGVLLAGLWLWLPLLLQAGEIKGLYQAVVQVSGQDEDERQAAVRQGLQDVLVKISGRRNFAAIPAINQALAGAMHYVQQFHYLDKHAGVQQMPGQGGATAQILSVSFDSEAINALVRQSGLPLWGRTRPLMLLWLAVEDGRQRYILGGTVDSDLRATLESQAQRRAVPLMFPLLDLQDRTSLRLADIWGDFQDVIMNASRRYQAGGVLVGRVYQQAADEWQVRWSLYQDGQVRQWSASAPDTEQLMRAGIDEMADILAGRFARTAADVDGGSLRLRVSDITTLEDYARTRNYLDSLDLVTAASTERIDATDVIFRLAIRGNPDLFEQAVVFGDMLAPIDASGQSDQSEPLLQYRLLP